MAKVAARWLKLENEGNGKSAAAVTIAHELSRASGTVYNYLTDKKYETRLYPAVRRRSQSTRLACQVDIPSV